MRVSQRAVSPFFSGSFLNHVDKERGREVAKSPYYISILVIRGRGKVIGQSSTWFVDVPLGVNSCDWCACVSCKTIGVVYRV